MYRLLFAFLLLLIVLCQAQTDNSKFTWCQQKTQQCQDRLTDFVCGVTNTFNLDFTNRCAACQNPIIRGYYLGPCPDPKMPYKLPQEETTTTNKITKTVTTTENGTMGVVAAQSTVVAPTASSTAAQPISTVTTVTSFTMPKAFSCEQLRTVSCIPDGGPVCGRSNSNKFTNFSNKCQACRDTNISEYSPTVCPNTDILNQVPNELPNVQGQPVSNLNSVTAMPTFVPIPLTAGLSGLSSTIASGINTTANTVTAGVNQATAAIQNLTSPLLTSTTKIVNTTAADGTTTIQNTTTTTITTLQNATIATPPPTPPPNPAIILTQPILIQAIPPGTVTTVVPPATQPTINLEPAITTIRNTTTVTPLTSAPNSPTDLQIGVQNTTIKTQTVQPAIVVLPPAATAATVTTNNTNTLVAPTVTTVPVPGTTTTPGITTTMTTTITTFPNAGDCNDIIRNNCVSDNIMTCGYTANGLALNFTDFCQACKNTQIVKYEKVPCPQITPAPVPVAVPVPVPIAAPTVWPPKTASQQAILRAQNPPPVTMTAIQVSDQNGKRVIAKTTFVPFSRKVPTDTIYPLFMCNYYSKFICFDDQVPVCGLEPNGNRRNFNNSCQACDNEGTQLFVKTDCKQYAMVYKNQPTKPFQKIEVPYSVKCLPNERYINCPQNLPYQVICGFKYNQPPSTYYSPCQACVDLQVYMWSPGPCNPLYQKFVLCDYSKSMPATLCQIGGDLSVCGHLNDETRITFKNGCLACQDERVRGYSTTGNCDSTKRQ